jgi:hypothetical protein
VDDGEIFGRKFGFPFSINQQIQPGLISWTARRVISKNLPSVSRAQQPPPRIRQNFCSEFGQLSS